MAMHRPVPPSFHSCDLLSTATNSQVDWYAWGAEAFEKARREDKPVFLSVGYSTCHCAKSVTLFDVCDWMLC